MGLKRRAVGRKQVLDLTEKQDSPRRSWQTKYQQICTEHNTQNGDSPKSDSGAVSSTSTRAPSNNPLSGLLANYHSDSDGDDDDDGGNDNAGDLDSKVSDFLKEIQTIVPSGSSLVVPGQLITTPGLVDENAVQSQQPATLSAWQECYDETTGYIYYWHTETNAVTWETPAEYLPQATASGQAPDAAASREASSLHHGITPAAQHEGLSQLPHNLQPWPHQGVPVTYPMMRPQLAQAPAMGTMVGRKGMKPLVEYNVKSADKASSDSEDERIEMITSFGESSEEESEEEAKPPAKKKKPNLEMIGPQLQIQPAVVQEIIGPKLELSKDVDLQPESDRIDEGSSLLSNQVDDVGPPGVEEEMKAKDPVMVSEEQPAVVLREDVSLGNSNAGSEQGEETLSSAIQANENSSSEVDSTTDSTIEPATSATPMESDGGDSTETDEIGILSRLRTQAKLLKELGGELPAELQELIEPSDTDPVEDVIEKVVFEPSPKPTEDIIVQAESPEQPSELPDFEKEMERMEQELQELAKSTKASSSVESSPKTTSFALIAGYGDDSDQEDEVEKAPPVEPIVQKRTFESLPTAPVKSLFPIAEHIATSEPKTLISVKHEKDVKSEEPLNLPLSPKVSHSILFPSVSSSTEVPLPALRLQESNEVGPETEQTISPPLEPILDSNLPKKAGKRKKRLDISTSAELVAASAASKAPPQVVTTSTWTTLPEGERKGLGFEKQESDADSFLLDCMSEFESKKVILPKEKENITFVKGDVLNGPKPDKEIIEEEIKPAVIEEEKVVCVAVVSEADTRMEEKASRQVGDLAQTIMEKAAFLAEGKEPASPVQVLAIQVETLVSAWHAGALSRPYLSKWLWKTGDELGQLETSAAPEGWACQWDRSHKRYYYCNLSTGETQWEYPESLEEEFPESEVAPQPQEIPKSLEPPAIQDIAGGELAMEICNTPPHSPSPPPTPPSPSPPPPPPPRSETPPPPPPPVISESRELSPPPPPRISPFPPPKNNDNRRQKGKKGKERPPPPSKHQTDNKQDRRSSPTPPPPDLNPPLPPLPPPPSSPPPPPPSDIPPLPTSPPRQQLAYGEPLPPGVDPGEIPYMAHPAQQLVYQPTELAAQPAADMESYQHAMQQAYVLAPYQPAMVQPGMTNVQGGPVMDYSGMPYMMHTHMTMPAVIAKPPAKKHKAALHAALDSFYSDLAIMEPQPTPEGVCEAAAVPAPLVEAAEEVAVTSEPAIEPDMLLKQADAIAKKKKVKKVVGLGLKKKGVSSLVAKWQQVQQEVRRDFETLDQDNDSQ